MMAESRAIPIRCTDCRAILGEMRDGVLHIGSVRVTRSQPLQCACGKVRVWQAVKERTP